MDVVKTCCQNFSEALQLATDHRYAHEYGDTAAAEEPGTRGENEVGPGDGKGGDCLEAISVTAAPCTRSRSDVRGTWRATELKAAVAEEEKESRSRGAAAGTDFGDALFSARKRRSFSLVLRQLPPVIDYKDLQR